MTSPVRQSPNLEVSGSYKVQLFQNVKFGTKAEILFDLDKRESWESEWETGLDFRMTKYLTFRNSYELKYRNEPVEGFKSADHKVLVSVKVDWR